MKARPTTPPGLPTASHVLPFELCGGHVLLRAALNGDDATFILDSGASACTLDTSWGHTLPAAGSPATATGGSDTVSITRCLIETLQIGSLVLRHEMAAIVPLTAVSEQHGRLIDGAIGHTIFAKYVVEIDYAARTLRLYEPNVFSYDGDGVVLPIDLTKRIPIAQVAIKPHGGSPINARLVLDLGAATLGAAFTAPFVEVHGSEFAASRQIATTSAGIGKSTSGSITRLEWLDAGGLRAHEPVAMLIRDHSGFFGVKWADGVLGSAFFQRTKTIFDYSRGIVILEADPGFNEPFAFDASGLTLAANAPSMDAVVARSVASQSAAERAGIRVGDVVISVGDQRASGNSIEILRGRLRESKDACPIVVRRDGIEMNFVVELRERI